MRYFLVMHYRPEMTQSFEARKAHWDLFYARYRRAGFSRKHALPVLTLKEAENCNHTQSAWHRSCRPNQGSVGFSISVVATGCCFLYEVVQSLNSRFLACQCCQSSDRSIPSHAKSAVADKPLRRIKQYT